jgi:hypothetical protein
MALSIFPRLAPAQTEEIIFDLGTMDINTIASFYPKLIFRPIDDLTPRMSGRAQGMAGAYLALASGAEALAWNPAGMTARETATLAADFYSSSSSGSTSGFPLRFEQDLPGTPPLFVATYDENLKSRYRFGLIGASGTPFALAGRAIHVGLAYRRHTNVAYPEEIVSELRFVEGTTTVPVVVANDNQESGAIEAATFGAAVEVAPGLSLGASANYLTGSLEADLATFVNVPGAGGQTTAEGSFTSDYKGISFEIGGRADVGPLTVAGWLGLPHTVEVTNGRLESRSIEIPGQPQFVTVGSLGGYDLDVPLFFSLGAAFRLGSRLTVAADVNSRPWGDAEVSYHDLDVDTSPNATSFYPAKDVQSFHAGVDYLLVQGNGFSIPVRAGFAYVPLSMVSADAGDTLDIALTIIPNADGSFGVAGGDGDPSFYGDEQAKAFAWALGAALVLEDVTFDMGFEARQYDFDRLFFESAGRRGLDFFINPSGRVGQVDRLEYILRFSTEYRF